MKNYLSANASATKFNSSEYIENTIYHITARIRET